MALKTALAALFTLSLSLCFAQEAPPKLAVYTSGASDVGVNRLLGSKLLSAMSQSGNYSEIADPALFQGELAKSGKSDMASIAQAAKRHGTEYVCVVTMTEAFGAHSISARLARVSDLQVLKSGTTDRTLKSLDDLTAVSNELVRQLLPSRSYVPSVPPPPPARTPAPAFAVAPTASSAISSTAPFAFLATGSFGTSQPKSSVTNSHSTPPVPTVAPTAGQSESASADAPDALPTAAVATAVAPTEQCGKKYNINEVIFKIKNKFPAKLKDCSGTLAKDMLTPASFGGHKLEPKSFLTQCTVDGVKNELPAGFPNKDKIVGSLTNFLQGIMNAALAGGSLDPKKLLSAVASLDITGLVNDVKKLAADECIVDEPYESEDEDDEDDDNDGEKKKSSVSFGIRAGINYSHIYAEYKIYPNGYLYPALSGSEDYHSIPGMQVGFVVDVPVSDWFHIQPGLMYIQKGMDDGIGPGNHHDETIHYIEFPLLLSLKFSAFRLNAGPYLGVKLFNYQYFDRFDLGLSTGIGFDIGMFYIGTFYDYGWVDVTSAPNYRFYNRTLGFNVGINL